MKTMLTAIRYFCFGGIVAAWVYGDIGGYAVVLAIVLLAATLFDFGLWLGRRMGEGKL